MARQHNLKIIIADDSNAMRAVLSSLFMELGYEVVSLLKDGVNVINDVLRYQADIVCLDYHMPKKDGLQVLNELHAKHPEVAVVMITSDEDPRVHEKATDLGAAGFIFKPFSQEQISAELTKVSTAIHSLRQLRQQTATEDAQFTNKTAVIVDDSETMRRLLKFILESSGLNVVGEGVHGKQALDLVKKHVPNLLCMDIDMPVMNGLTALGEIKPIYPDVPVIMISGHNDKKSVIEAVNKGASGYIVKPFDPDLIEAEIKKVIPDLNADDLDSLFDPA